MDTLRVSCPWDARQTHESLTPHLLEETYEALDALASGDQAAVREELGDVLLQVIFHARVAQERTDGTGPNNRKVDRLTIDLTYAGKESYKLATMNGSPTKQTLESLDGLITGGKFGSLLLGVYDPSSSADF